MVDGASLAIRKSLIPIIFVLSVSLDTSPGRLLSRNHLE